MKRSWEIEIWVGERDEAEVKAKRNRGRMVTKEEEEK